MPWLLRPRRDPPFRRGSEPFRRGPEPGVPHERRHELPPAAPLQEPGVDGIRERVREHRSTCTRMGVLYAPWGRSRRGRRRRRVRRRRGAYRRRSFFFFFFSTAVRVRWVRDRGAEMRSPYVDIPALSLPLLFVLLGAFMICHILFFNLIICHCISYYYVCH